MRQPIMSMEPLFRRYIHGRISRREVINIFQRIAISNEDLELVKDLCRKIVRRNARKKAEDFICLMRVSIGIETVKRDEAWR